MHHPCIFFAVARGFTQAPDDRARIPGPESAPSSCSSCASQSSIPQEGIIDSFVLQCAPAVDKYTRARMEAMLKSLYFPPTLSFSQFLIQQNYLAGRYPNRPSHPAPPVVPSDDGPSKNETESSADVPLSPYPSNPTLNNEKSTDDVVQNSPVASQPETVQPEYIVPSTAYAHRQNDAPNDNVDYSKSAAHPPNDINPDGHSSSSPEIPEETRAAGAHGSAPSELPDSHSNSRESDSTPAANVPNDEPKAKTEVPTSEYPYEATMVVTSWNSHPSDESSAKIDSNRPTPEAPQADGVTAAYTNIQKPKVESQLTTEKPHEPLVFDQVAEPVAHPAAHAPADNWKSGGSNKVEDHSQPPMEVPAADSPHQLPKVNTDYTGCDSTYPPKTQSSPTYEKPTAESDSSKPMAQYVQPEDRVSQAPESADSAESQSQVTQPLSFDSYGNACVLSPETNVGPKYRHERHPIRQNIAEYQDGLLLVSFILLPFMEWFPYFGNSIAYHFPAVRHRCH